MGTTRRGIAVALAGGLVAPALALPAPAGAGIKPLIGAVLAMFAVGLAAYARRRASVAAQAPG